MVSLREKQKHRTPQRLIEAALDLSSTKGYRNTSVEDLPRCACWMTDCDSEAYQ